VEYIMTRQGKWLRIFCTVVNFHKRANPIRVLAYLLPDKTDAHYVFRRRRHSRQLLPKLSELYDSNFIVRICYISNLTDISIITSDKKEVNAFCPCLFVCLSVC